MMKRISIWVLGWLVNNADIRIYSAAEPFGKRLGGYDIQNVKDKYIIFRITVKNQNIFLGYWQAA